MTKQTAGANVGHIKPEFFKNTFVGDQSALQNEKGKRRSKGTSESIKSIGRSKNFYGEEFDIDLHDEWMVRLGEYGDLHRHVPLQWIVDFSKVKSDSQQFRFNTNYVFDSPNDQIIDLIQNDKTYVSGDYDNPFDKYDIISEGDTTIENSQITSIFNKDAGLPLVNEIDYFVGKITNISDIYDPTEDYARVPNWNNAVSYRIGDRVRFNGIAYQAIVPTNISSTELDNVIVQATQVSPEIPNGQTLILNGDTITFENFNVENIRNPIEVIGTVENPVIPYGSSLRIDNVNITFKQTGLFDTFNDIVLRGSVTAPTIQNSTDRKITIFWANNTNDNLNEIEVNFNSYDQFKSITNIYRDFLDYRVDFTPNSSEISNIFLNPGHPVTILSNAHGFSNGQNVLIRDVGGTTELNGNIYTITLVNVNQFSLNGTNSSNFTEYSSGGQVTRPDIQDRLNTRITRLNEFREDYIAAGNNWNEWITQYHGRDRGILEQTKWINPNFIDTTISQAAQNLYNADIALINAISRTDEMLRARINNVDKIISDLFTNPNNTDFQNLLALFNYYSTSTEEFNSSTRVRIPRPTDFAVDNLDTIVSKINTAVNNVANITAISTPNGIVLRRSKNSRNYRFGISEDEDLGFRTNQTDVSTSFQGVEIRNIDSDLNNIIESINSQNINNIRARSNNNRLTIISDNETVNFSGVINEIGFPSDPIKADTTEISIPINSEINDIVRQINNAGLLSISASQNNNRLTILFGGQTLVIGEGTANNELGLTPGSYTKNVESDDNFIVDNWEQINDPANFNIWVVNNINETEIIQNTHTGYNVYQTADIHLGVEECCAGVQVGDDALIKTTKDHYLSTDDYVLILNSTCVPSIDGIHKVSDVLNDTTFFVETFIEQKGFTGKVIPLRQVRFNTTEEVNDTLNDKRFFNDGELQIGTKMFVDDVDSTNIPGVYELFLFNDEEEGIEELRYRLVRTTEAKTRNDTIRNAQLFNPKTKQTLISYEVYDPLQGIIPGAADREIDIRSEIDNAYYNNSTSADKRLNTNNAWSEEQVGRVWWDLSTAIYLNYNQGDNEYKQQYWGKLFPTSTIDVYEWTKSPVPPDEYMNAVDSALTLNGIELTGIPYGEQDQFGDVQYHWTEDIVLNPNTNQLETYYYFWVGKKTTTPNLERIYSVIQLEELIQNPLLQGIHWIAASSENTLLVSGLDNIFHRDDLMIQINFKRRTNDYHQEFILVPENDPTFILPEILHIGLHDSLTGYANFTQCVTYEEWDKSTQYSRDNVVKFNNKFYILYVDQSTLNNPEDSDNEWRLLDVADSNPDGYISTYTDSMGDTQFENIVKINLPKTIPNHRMNEFVRYGIQFDQRQSWFNNIRNARKHFTDKLNDQLKKIDLVVSDIPWRTELKKDDITPYWDFVDWSTEPLNMNNIDFTIDNISDLDDLDAVEGNTALISITYEEDDPRKVIYKYINDKWTVVFREKGTIQFNTLLWNERKNSAGWDTAAWDTDDVDWDRSSSFVLSQILTSLYEKLWIGQRRGLYNDLWISMAQYVLQEQDEVDWLFKSSYFKMKVNDKLDKDFSNYFREKPEELMEYVNTVKPFRSKNN